MKRARGWTIGGSVLLVLFGLLLVATALLPADNEMATGSITNPKANGARALAEVLRAQGVGVTQVTALGAAEAAAVAGSTLAVYLDQALSEDAVTGLSEVPADLVVLYAGYDLDVTTLTGGAFESAWWWREAQDVPPAACDDPDALAAGTLLPADDGVVDLTGRSTLCFQDDSGVALYADAQTVHHRVTVVAGDGWLTNAGITQEGNAALALRTLGRHDRVTWYLPGADALPAADDQQPVGSRSLWLLLPGWAQAVFFTLLIAGGAAAVWRGRRFGALVREKLPVAVPASEASSGLGRLYRQSGARGHAAAALRAASIARLAPRLGLPTSASPALVVERLSEALSRPQAGIAPLLYGPVPADDAQLVGLATQLSDLEGELTRHD